MNREQILRTIMAIIYRGGHWSNQDVKFDEILLFVHEELGMHHATETADEYNERNRIS